MASYHNVKVLQTLIDRGAAWGCPCSAESPSE